MKLKPVRGMMEEFGQRRPDRRIGTDSQEDC